MITRAEIDRRRPSVSVAIYGSGQLGMGVGDVLSRRAGVEIRGPYNRAHRTEALASGADVVIIATTSLLQEVGPDIRAAIESGSNVLTSCEEAFYPWVVDPVLADELATLAAQHNVTIAGCGLNPGFAYDALVVTMTGPAARVASVRVERVADLSRFSHGILRRTGIGFTEDAFASGVASSEITGHIGFGQSMHITARALGVRLDCVTTTLAPIIATKECRGEHIVVSSGRSAGFRQQYVGIVGGVPWFEAVFLGHVDLQVIGEAPRDEMWIEATPPIHMTVTPGLNPQSGSAAIIANSVYRVISAEPGWPTVADLRPAASW